MDTIIITNTIYTPNANEVAEALRSVDPITKAKTRRKADRMSRAARSEALEKLGVKVVTPVTAAASKKAQWEEEDRQAMRQALKAAREAVKAKEEAEKKANEAFGKSAMAQAMAKALASKA